MSILLTGGSGFLGSRIIKSNLFRGLNYPTRLELDLTNIVSVKRYLSSLDYDTVIHCAALARITNCQQSPEEAILNNIVGTSNLVTKLLEKWKSTKKGFRLIHISTDGVYKGDNGNFHENRGTLPYNYYGWSKLGAECAVRLVPNHVIVRTRFFDQGNISFDESATDIHTSSIPVDDLVSALRKLIDSDFVGTINIGGERISDYERNKQYKRSIKPTTREKIEKIAKVPLSKDTSMDCSLWMTMEKSQK